MHDAIFVRGGRVHLLLWAASVWLLCACFAATKPLDSTQTGNPPVIDTDRLALKVTSDMVHILGEPGAVRPGDASVKITNLSNGEVARGAVAADGSFDVRVDGSQNDAYVVEAEAGGKTSSSVYVVLGGAAVSDGKQGALSCGQRGSLAATLVERVTSTAARSCNVPSDCELVRVNTVCSNYCGAAPVAQTAKRELEAARDAISDNVCQRVGDVCDFKAVKCSPTLAAVTCSAGQCAEMTGTVANDTSCRARSQTSAEQLQAAYAMADKRCMVDSDCVAPKHTGICHDECYEGPYVSQGGRASITQAVENINGGTCKNFAADGCQFELQPCVPPAPQVAACRQNQCVAVAPDPNMNMSVDAGTTGPECMSCVTEAIGWGATGGLIAYEDHSSVAACAHYTRTRDDHNNQTVPVSCETDLVACNAVASVGAIESALADKEVQAALAASPTLFGVDQRAFDGQLFQIELGKRMIQVGGSCDNAPPNCIPVPMGVQRLVDVLNSIDAGFASNVCANLK